MKSIKNYQTQVRWALEKPNKWKKKGLDCSCECFCVEQNYTYNQVFIPKAEFVVKYRLSRNEVLNDRDTKIRKIEEIGLPEYLDGVVINISSFRRDGGYQEFPISVIIKDVEEMKVNKKNYERKIKLDNLKNLFKDE